MICTAYALIDGDYRRGEEIAWFESVDEAIDFCLDYWPEDPATPQVIMDDLGRERATLIHGTTPEICFVFRDGDLKHPAIYSCEYVERNGRIETVVIKL